LTHQHPARSAIALGSNLGNSLETLEGALDALRDAPGITVETYSSWYRTAPVGGPSQPDYLNGCALVQTTLEPHDLLATILGIETTFGRVRQVHWGPRTLDLDLLLYGDRIIDTPTLEVPHPRMSQRAFVLMPLAEIAPDWIDPVSGQTIGHLLDRVDQSGVQKMTDPASLGQP